jgi:hypothetical protein
LVDAIDAIEEVGEDGRVKEEGKDGQGKEEGVEEDVPHKL